MRKLVSIIQVLQGFVVFLVPIGAVFIGESPPLISLFLLAAIFMPIGILGIVAGVKVWAPVRYGYFLSLLFQTLLSIRFKTENFEYSVLAGISIDQKVYESGGTIVGLNLFSVLILLVVLILYALFRARRST